MFVTSDRSQQEMEQYMQVMHAEHTAHAEHEEHTAYAVHAEHTTYAEHAEHTAYAEHVEYVEHVDHSPNNMRTVSCSIILNDDFEGGEFGFFSRAHIIKPSKGDVIMFPSNFLYRHQVLPVTKGTRYSIITWFK